MAASETQTGTNDKLSMPSKQDIHKSKQVLDSIHRIHWCISYRLILTLNKEDYDKWQTHTKCFTAASLYCGGQLTDSDLKIYTDNKEAINNLIELADTLTVCKEFRSQNINLRVLYYELICDSENAEIYRKRLQQSGELKAQIDWAAFRKNRRGINSTFRKLISRYRDKKALKIHLTIKDVIALLAITSPFILVSGYLYDYYYLSYFGIDTSLFFTLSDYVASSITHIQICIVSAVLCLAFGLLSAHQESLNIAEGRKDNTKSNKSFMMVMLLICTVTVSALGFRQHDPRAIYLIVYLFLITIMSIYIAPFITRRFFNESLRHFMMVYFICFYVLSFSFVILMARYDGAHGKSGSQYKTSLEMTTKLNGYNVLMANSGYIFFYDPTTKNALVLPKSQLQSASISKAK